jgi:hypothetical protein
MTYTVQSAVTGRQKSAAVPLEIRSFPPGYPQALHSRNLHRFLRKSADSQTRFPIAESMKNEGDWRICGKRLSGRPDHYE